jgi:hypothetical protein
VHTRTCQPAPSARCFPNLLIRVSTPAELINRQFTATRLKELWCTEHPARDGKVYCCAILDCFSGMIVDRTFPPQLVDNAVNVAAFWDRLQVELSVRREKLPQPRTSPVPKTHNGWFPGKQGQQGRQHRARLADGSKRRRRLVLHRER